MKKENYVLQRLAPAQWEDYKKVRLEALHTDPGVFGSNYQREGLTASGIGWHYLRIKIVRCLDYMIKRISLD
ncbi:hypothetical protein KUH03_28880 [Sphingobacterium sp. E70]|uniref:hypothetical protein n=1 Tax=Sphingobacterium sp. E70 TaxID=2853439 RepID=UPI00211CB715|nr:hypothetical protein [Sphingobacterium sp. E70]ULT23201.1 hypothetical protein KUH03_28880 [Sphingobacterium sp. E70]